MEFLWVILALLLVVVLFDMLLFIVVTVVYVVGRIMQILFKLWWLGIIGAILIALILIALI